MNRLADATSPYLLQHAANPVDWWEWGPEAFEAARSRDVPLLISVGYAACHWCHVMAHESFEDPEVARLMNAYTVPVKVDREERPDVDAVYMTATQAMTGQGGWPMTVFATPDGAPFFCGTYFPRDNFIRLLESIDNAWRDKRDAVVQQGQLVVEAIEGVRPAAAGKPLTAELLDAAAAQLAREHDSVDGGFGGAPKFPPSMCLEFLLRHHARTGSDRSLQVVRHTCERMARGGMYDQLAGGFARYSVDARWVVPHFEKMLYDNALLLRVYSHLWRATGDQLARRVAGATARFLVDELATPEGGFASALDADTDGVEGATYAWTPAQLRDVLGEADGDWAAELLSVTDAGSFEPGTSVLQLLTEPDDPQRWRRVRETLLAARRERPQPARDDKVVAAWNGLSITALLEYANIARSR
ncbi:MAG: thioredoxin domain-containing protein, partial [Micromonosporaceae bacterium]